MREALLALCFVLAAGLAVTGVALLSVPAAFLVAGALTAVLGYLFLADVSPPEAG